MALSETTRAEMYNSFSATPLGKEVTSEMIANFPDLKFDDLVTKDFLRAELEAQSGVLRKEMADIRFDLAKDTHDTVQKSMLWTIATMIALAGVLSGLGFAFH